jgi:hypothetical protein
MDNQVRHVQTTPEEWQAGILPPRILATWAVRSDYPMAHILPHSHLSSGVKYEPFD